MEEHIFAIKSPFIHSEMGNIPSENPARIPPSSYTVQCTLSATLIRSVPKRTTTALLNLQAQERSLRSSFPPFSSSRRVSTFTSHSITQSWRVISSRVMKCRRRASWYQDQGSFPSSRAEIGMSGGRGYGLSLSIEYTG